MSNKTKSIMGQVGLMAFAFAVIGVGAYHFGKNTSQEESILPVEPVSTQYEPKEQGKRIYVSLDGKDTNPGTKESPKRTIGAAISAANTTGDTIVVKSKSTGSG